MNRILIVDGPWLLWRAFHVALFRRNFKYFGRSIPSTVLSMIAKDFRETRSTHLAVTFDAPKSFRYKIYPHYKEGRQKVKTVGSILGDKANDLPPEIQSMSPYQFLPTIKECLTWSGIHWVSIKNMESDDMLGAAALNLAAPDTKVILETGDKDLMQVVNDKRGVCIYQPGVGKKEARYITRKEVIEMKGVKPSQIRDYLCLIGDSIDNIPGVPDIAEVRARKILATYGSIKEALKHKNKMTERLHDNINGLYLARKLVDLNTECWYPEVSDLKIGKLQEKEIVNILGKVPSGIEDLHAQKALASTKGLFG